MSHDLADKIRTGTAFLSAVGLLLLVLETKHLWKFISGARKLRYISLSMFGSAICYGSLEAAYWPQHQIRVVWLFLAALSMVIAGWAGVKKNRDNRQEYNNRAGK
jgi:hypothetical protein